MNNLLPTSPHQNFEDIKKNDLGGIEYWEARDLMSLLSYHSWQKFHHVISKAIISCKKSEQSVSNHFTRVGKMIKIGTGSHKEALREIENYKLSRYGCYLIAQNGDPSKTEIATAQTYFAIQTRRQELSQNTSKDDILDRADSTELAVNLFRITQTEAKLKRENILGQGKASITHLVVGTKVRKSIAEIGGTMPENLPPAPHIKKLTPGQQKLLK